jgi:hypothetical protein
MAAFDLISWSNVIAVIHPVFRWKAVFADAIHNCVPDVNIRADCFYLAPLGAQVASLLAMTFLTYSIETGAISFG